MAKQFDPRKVLRQTSNDLLRQFFEARGDLAAVDWTSLTETDIEVVFDAWQELPEAQRRDVQVTLQDVNELADERGLRVLAEEINWRSPTRMREFAAVESRIDKAMWVYLNERQAFEEAARFAHADALSIGRYWNSRNRLPRRAIHVSEEVKSALGKELSDYYMGNQGRGRWCHVDHYPRSNGNEYFFAYLDDYPDSRLTFDDAGTMRKHRERTAFDNVFVYRPADGTLETFLYGGKKVREPLEEIFCEVVLGEEVGPAPANDAAYRLDGLIEAQFPFPTDPSDGVADVRVRRLRLEVVNAPGRRITLEAGPKDHPKAVYDMFDQYLNEARLPRSGVRVLGATLTLTFHAENGARPRTLTFDVSHPSSCDLKSKARSDEHRAAAERCLRHWGISRG